MRGLAMWCVVLTGCGAGTESARPPATDRRLPAVVQARDAYAAALESLRTLTATGEANGWDLTAPPPPSIEFSNDGESSAGAIAIREAHDERMAWWYALDQARGAAQAARLRYHDAGADAAAALAEERTQATGFSAAHR